MSLIKERLDQIRSQMQIDLLDLNLSPLFNSNQNNYRQLIRDEISKNHKSDLNTEEILSIQNLDTYPKTSSVFFCISHNQELGGYSVASCKHGFDIELKSRISTAIVQRVSTEAELSSAPDSKFVWCAKEAAFKALSPTVITVADLEVVDWQSQNETGLWAYRVTSKKTLDQTYNLGFLFQDNTQIYSIYFL